MAGGIFLAPLQGMKPVQGLGHHLSQSCCESYVEAWLTELHMQAFAGIVTVSVGHCHPKVVDAVKRQSELLQHTTTIYLNPQIALYAKELTDRLPGNLKVIS